MDRTERFYKIELLLRGRALYSQGKLAAAEQAFARALEQDPADQDARQMRGISLYRLGKPEAAIPLLESHASDPRTGQASKTPTDPQYVLALCYLDTRRYDDARRAFAGQYGFPPDSASAYLLAARMRFMLVARALRATSTIAWSPAGCIALSIACSL